MQPVPGLRISERLVRVPSDQNTRWRLPYSQKQKKPLKSIEGRRDAAFRREGVTGWGLHWGLRTRLGNLFVYAMCYLFLFSYMNDTLFKSFSMHLFCHTWYNHASLYHYYLFEGTHI